MNSNQISTIDRDTIVAEYFDKLLYPPYPVQEEAIFAWFSSDEGVIVCAPTGTGKTLIAEAAIYEALRTGKQCYYTTPLIALTDQKLAEIQQAAVRWGFPMTSVGLITGNRRVNPDAPVLVVVAEILLNRLMQDRESFDSVSSVVMDEFHSFNDPERGIVWELSLGMLPRKTRIMLLSATIGNSVEFCSWLMRAHGRNLELVQSTDRKVPLQFEWVDDAFLDEHLERIAEGDEAKRRTPGLVFCFNRDQCWQVAELLKGKRLIDKERQAILTKRLEAFDFSHGAGPKLKQVLIRGVGVHHAGLMPRYRRIVEQLFQEKLLSVTVCTETLSAGINLPARSVILPSMVKGPFGKKKIIEPSSAQQIFGRAGRPQFDSQGFVYVLAHEDDVKHLRWKKQYDLIPEDTKDPNLLRAKKQLKKKMPTRRTGETYWSKEQFEKLCLAPAAKLISKGLLPWRLLAYVLLNNSNVQPLRELVGKRLLPNNDIAQAQRELNQMLITLWTAGFVNLFPKPLPAPEAPKKDLVQKEKLDGFPERKPWIAYSASGSSDTKAELEEDESASDDDDTVQAEIAQLIANEQAGRGYDLDNYRPERAEPTDRLELVAELRSVNPLYGLFMIHLLQFANEAERVQAIESVLELPANISKLVQVPLHEELPFGPLATEVLHPKLLELGLAGVQELTGANPDDDDESPDLETLAANAGGTSRSRYGGDRFGAPPPRPIPLAEKMRRLFNYDFPRVHDLYTRGVWVVGELLEFNCEFHKYIAARGFQKQEGILFRHVLRFILLAQEISNVAPENSEAETWEQPWDSLIQRLTDCCRIVDPESTDEVLQDDRSE
ncbi:MAG: DEAD/DEAH box helicase [Pirellula sp.]